MILEAIYNGNFYPSETVVPKSEKYRNALKACEKIMDRLTEKLSKEDYDLVEDARRTSATSRLASRRDCWCSRKRWSRSRRSMTNETAAGVRLDDPAAVSFIKKLRSEGETGPPERQKSFYRCAFSRIHFHHAISNANVCLDILGRTRLFFQLFA